LQPRTFVVGRIDPHEPDAASSVAGYERKLAVIEVNSRVVLPADDQDQARAANAQRGDDGVELVPVRTWKQAARKSRALARRRLFALASACLLILALAGFGLYRASLSDRAAEERRAVAADLAARSSFLRSTDPLLAAKLGLAAHRIDPENSRAVEALRTVLVDNRNMVRAWQADVSRVDAIAVDESLDRVLTSGSEESTKLWKQSTGQPLGHLPTHTLLMTKASDQAIVAGMTTEGLALFDIGSEQLSQIGKIETTCAPDDDAVAMGFTHSDTKLVVVWESGAISTHDVLTRTQLSCLSWQEALTPLTFNSLPMDKVVAADVIGPAYNDRSDDEVVLVLSNNNVVSVRTGSRDARIEVPADKLTADASLVSGSGTTISLATDLGVVVWNRTDQTLLLNPAGGLAKRPRTISESNGSLLVSGSAGTVVVPLSSSGWKVPESLKTPSGGAATVAAIDDHSIMAGGPGGRVWAIADSTGELTIGRRTPVSSVRFLPDGQLLTAEVPSDGGKSIGTNSNGLAIIDPKAQLKYDGTDPQIPRWENGGSQNRFYVNDVAVSDYYVAAAGQVNRRAAVLVWSRFGDRKVPRELLFPQPDDEKSKPQEKIVGAVEFTSDGKTLLARHVRGQIGMWSTETWKSTGTIDLKSDNARFTVHSGHAFAFQADDKKSELVKIDLTTREVTRRVAVPNAVQLTANQDGDKVVTMTWDNSIQTWDGELRAVGTSWRPVSNGDPSWEIKISPNGKLLAIGQGDNVQIYDTGLRTQTVPAIDTRANIVVGLNWSFDSELLAMSTMTPTRGLKQVGPLQIWRVGGQDWTSQVCRLTDGGLSPDEWSAYGAGKLPFIDICAEVRK
ncbi:MAG TPA: WD40 repeat domain-containing protein, partial [Lentzea sp.]